MRAANLFLLAFVAALLVCLVTSAPLLWAMALGYMLFAGYTWHSGKSWMEIARLTAQSVWQVRMVLVVLPCW